MVINSKNIILPPGKELIFSNESKNGRHFLIFKQDGIRDYTAREYLDFELAQRINNEDKLFTVNANGYPYQTEDICELIKPLLLNKIIQSARLFEANKLYKAIRECFNNKFY